MGTPVRSTDPADHVVAHRVPVRGQVLRWAPVINTDSWSGGRTSRKVRRPRDHVLFVWFVRHRVCRTPTPLAQLAAGAGATNRKVCVDTVRVGVNRVARGLISCGPAADPGRSVSRVPPIGRVGHDGHSGHSKSALCFPLNALAYRHLPVKSVAELTRWRRRFRICPFFWCSACAILASMKQGLKIVPPPSVPMAVARALAKSFFSTATGVFTLRVHRGHFYQWNGGHWSAMDTDDVRGEVYRQLEHAHYEHPEKGTLPFAPSQGKVNNVMDTLRAIVELDTNVEAPCWTDAASVDRLPANEGASAIKCW